MAKSYSEKLRDPRWQRKRLEIFQRDNWMCTNCGDCSKTLQVHHTIYYSKTDPWNYESEVLKTLCEPCHKKEHNLIKDPEVKEWHWQIREHGNDNSTSVQTHIDILMMKLSSGVPREIEEEILKNIVFLQQQKKYLNGQD